MPSRYQKFFGTTEFEEEMPAFFRQSSKSRFSNILFQNQQPSPNSTSSPQDDEDGEPQPSDLKKELLRQHHKYSKLNQLYAQCRDQLAQSVQDISKMQTLID